MSISFNFSSIAPDISMGIRRVPYGSPSRGWIIQTSKSDGEDVSPEGDGEEVPSNGHGEYVPPNGDGEEVPVDGDGE